MQVEPQPALSTLHYTLITHHYFCPVPIPIVFIHTGTAPYVPFALMQARYTNPGGNLVLLGDRTNRHLSRLARHLPQRHFWKQAGELEKAFINLSTNPPAFELICLQRWMCLLEWMQAENIDRCLYLDTDVLLYNQADALFKHVLHHFPQAEMTVVGISGHTNFITGRAGLEAFCNFILDAYLRPGGSEWLKEQYRLFRETHSAGGISDMSFFTWFREANSDRVSDLATPLPGPDGRLWGFDITLDYHQHMQWANGYKQVQGLAIGTPLASLVEGGETVLMQTLHFQGASKSQMARYAQGQQGAEHLRNLAHWQWARLRRKVGI